MAFKIVWTPEALTTYLAHLEYLETQWSQKEVISLVKRVEDKLVLLSKFPSVGSPFDKKRNLRKTLLHKRLQLYYRVRPVKQQIELITFWHTSKDPAQLNPLSNKRKGK